MMRTAIGRRWLPAAGAAVLMAIAGAALVVASRLELADAGRQLAAARTERNQAQERLARIAQDEREVTQRIGLYRRLTELNIVGSERRMEWTESIARIRDQRQIPDLRYQIAPRRMLATHPGKAGSVDSYASTMKVELGLLHEGDLVGFLQDLRAAGNAYYAVNRCALNRTAAPASGPASAPRLRAACEIDLITLEDGGSRT